MLGGGCVYVVGDLCIDYVLEVWIGKEFVMGLCDFV